MEIRRIKTFEHLKRILRKPPSKDLFKFIKSLELKTNISQKKIEDGGKITLTFFDLKNIPTEEMIKVFNLPLRYKLIIERCEGIVRIIINET